ncbi:MAG TPA: Hpt domain-containing protein [Sphingomonas sp.]|jgi:HPt (histidine-containing phosphotransfer) domain-containing protein
MAYDPGAIDATLAAAVGDEPGLIAELRVAFHDSAERALAALDGAGDEASWRDAAWRLKGLAASFGAVRLMAMASDAADSPVGDVETLRKLRRALERLA